MAAVEISQEDLASFHNAHFATVAVNHFAQQFLGPVDEEYQEEDDGLGYYDDGVKRTLTDEQIRIFRHSEIEKILRDRRHTKEARNEDTPGVTTESVEEAEMEDGELNDSPVTETPTPPHNSEGAGKKKSRRQKQKHAKSQKSFFKQNIKPDLRKRTWDKVEDGLGDLQYDDMGANAPSAPSQASQRRRISYDDD
ncbi:Uncharacterized protein BP5553_02476 [Venustampulla echinocandica]|uniref:Uncharacterized protein n=1 Tax=Venustampulla echinocandica TaxID=2656787 RepID=A0A370U3Y7_9HELO|nr:Uncharacterized protein BP5553_02476 [Venustampulla echinocandica]RDL42497.1 Uncharacterized protein BP5553_02476 [Venustampulla echinocandica]